MITKMPTQLLNSKRKRLIAIKKQPNDTIFTLLICFRSTYPTIAISSKKTKIPFMVSNSPV